MAKVNFCAILFLSVAFSFDSISSRQTETLRYVGQPIPPNCSASYSCDPSYATQNNECLRWRVNKISCNKRLMRIETPSYVEVVTVRPRSRGRVTSTTEDPGVEVSTKAVQSVHIIDIPCITGFLPDRHGRCREMW